MAEHTALTQLNVANMRAKFDANKRSGTTTILLTQDEAFTEAGKALSVNELKAYLLDKGLGFPITVRKYPRDADDANTPYVVSMYVYSSISTATSNLLCHNIGTAIIQPNGAQTRKM